MIMKASRKEDMSPNGHLKVVMDNDGDIHVAIFPDNKYDGIEDFASVEFTTIGIGGGQSPHTFEALKQLIKAMELDNKEWPGRAGEI